MTDDFEMFDNVIITNAIEEYKFATIVGEESSGYIVQFLDFAATTIKGCNLRHLDEFEEIEFVKDKLYYLDKLAQAGRDFLKDNQVEPY